MGYIYRPRLKGDVPDFTPTPADLALRRGGPGDDPARCHHPRHAKADVCPGCGARFSPVWWAKYYINGKAVRESTESTKETEARQWLKSHEGKVADGVPIKPKLTRILYDELAADLRAHYQATGERNLDEADNRFDHLNPFFTLRRAADIGSADVTEYIAARQAEGAANGTIIQELGVLGRMFRVAFENKKLLQVPIIHKPKAAKPRAGFFERSQFEAVKRYLRPDLQVAVTIAYAFGWRMQSEVLMLQRRQVDLNACTLRLDPGMTKNDEGRVVSLPPELVELLQAQEERVLLLEMELGRKVPHLFPYLSGEHKGKRIQDFRKAWQTACLEAMLEGLEGEERTRREADLKAALKRKEKPGLLKMLRHDFRRTAVRNMVNRGVPERVAMKVTGHKTRNVFDRYHIVSPADLQEAARKLAGTFSGTLSENRENRKVEVLEKSVLSDGGMTISQQNKGSLSEPLVFLGGADGTRTRDLRRDRPAF